MFQRPIKLVSPFFNLTVYNPVYFVDDSLILALFKFLGGVVLEGILARSEGILEDFDVKLEGVLERSGEILEDFDVKFDVKSADFAVFVSL